MQRNSAIPLNHDVRKKVRGSTRRLHSFERQLGSLLLGIPDESLPHDKTWRYHLPSPEKLIDSTQSSNKLRRKFLQLLVDKLVELDGSIKGKYSALLSVTLPFLSQSRIEICVDDKHFEKLTNKTDAPSTWTPLGQERNIVKELNIAVPTGYRAKGYAGKSTGANARATEENWIIWKA